MQILFVVAVVVHVLAALTGFGSLALSGIYGFSARSSDGSRRQEAARWFASPDRAAWALLAVPVLGLVALIVQPGGRGPGQLWDLLALVVWAVAAGVWWWRQRPAVAALRAQLTPTTDSAPPGPATDSAPAGPATEAATTVGRAGVITDLAFAVALVLMVLQPH